MTEAAARMLRAMDRAVAEWYVPVIGKEKGRDESREHDVGVDCMEVSVFHG